MISKKSVIVKHIRVFSETSEIKITVIRSCSYIMFMKVGKYIAGGL